jgi:hypothetical protein
MFSMTCLQQKRKKQGEFTFISPFASDKPGENYTLSDITYCIMVEEKTIPCSCISTGFSCLLFFLSPLLQTV